MWYGKPWCELWICKPTKMFLFIPQIEAYKFELYFRSQHSLSPRRSIILCATSQCHLFQSLSHTLSIFMSGPFLPPWSVISLTLTTVDFCVYIRFTQPSWPWCTVTQHTRPMYTLKQNAELLKITSYHVGFNIAINRLEQILKWNDTGSILFICLSFV